VTHFGDTKNCKSKRRHITNATFDGDPHHSKSVPQSNPLTRIIINELEFNGWTGRDHSLIIAWFKNVMTASLFGSVMTGSARRSPLHFSHAALLELGKPPREIHLQFGSEGSLHPVERGCSGTVGFLPDTWLQMPKL